MPVFYLEQATHHPSNRGTFKQSKEVIQFPFKKNNRLKEVWRSMFLYDTPNPNEESRLYGDFYLEMDKGTFAEKKSMVLDIVEFLRSRYNIPNTFLNFFLTNRSLWISVPAKVFAAKKMKKLNQVYRYMAEEIQNFLKSKGYQDGLDLSIYKWNGLIHSLGSFLPNSSRWVSKFYLNDLEESNTIEELSQAKFDNFSTYEDVQVVTKASKWFTQSCISLFSSKKAQKKTTKNTCYEPMKELAKRGTLEQNRNLHIYSYALYLKENGYSLDESIVHIQDTFKDSYVQTRECLRTISSAFRGNKHYSYSFVKSFCDADLLENVVAQETIYTKTFIVPRLFIEWLQKVKANQHIYKLLLNIIHAQQIERKPFMYDLKGEKHKSLILSYFQKIQDTGIIRYVLENNVITAELTFQERSVYQSHIVLPVEFLHSKFFKKSGREFILYIELMKSSLKPSEDKNVWFVNILKSTLIKRLGMKKSTLDRYFNMLKKWKVYFRGFVFTASLFEYKQKVRDFVNKIKSNRFKFLVSVNQWISENAKWDNALVNTFFFFASLLIIKCNYSGIPKIRNHPLHIRVSSVFAQ